MGIDILIPVLNRPRNVTPLVASIEQSTSVAYRIWFICSPADYDEMRAIEAEGLEPLIFRSAPGAGDFARKINYAFDLTEAEWVFQGADDLRFHPGWDTNALGVARQTGRRVIGTNDLHHPGTRNGSHATHILFARSYIEEYGGTFDDSGRVFHDGYDHQFVDNEFVATARTRGEWAFSRKSIVEHFHPHWGNAEPDATYTKAMRSTRDDHVLHLKRMRDLRDFRRRVIQ